MHKYAIIFLTTTFVFFITFNLYSQCVVSKLGYNGMSKNGSTFLNSENLQWFEIDNNSNYLNNKIEFNNKSLPSGSKIQIYTSYQCLLSQLSSPIYNSLISNQLEIDLQNYSEPKLYVLIRADSLKPGLFTIKYKGNYLDTYSNFKFNETNGLEQPSFLELLLPSTPLCVSDINNGCQGILPYINPDWSSNHFFSKIYKIKSLNFGAAYLKLTGYSNKSINIDLMAYNQDTKELKHLSNIGPLDSTFNESYISTDGYDDFYLIVSSIKKEYASYDLCISGFTNLINCIDIDDSGDKLEVVSASMGSDFDGPFKPGEIIGFEYTIKRWVPINQSFIHSIVPTIYGPIESLDSFPELPDTIHWYIQTNEEILSNSLMWYKDTTGNTLKYKGLGWYSAFPGGGPSGAYPMDFWGMRIKSHKTSLFNNNNNPIITVKFNIKILDSIDCEAVNEIRLRLATYSDYRTGNYALSSCTDNSYEEFNSTVECCPTMNLVLLDSILCTGEPIRLIHNEKFISSKWEITKENNHGSLNEEKGFTSFYSRSNRIIDDTVQVNVYTVFDHQCYDTNQVDLIIHALPKVDLGKDIKECLNRDIQLYNKDKQQNNTQYTWQYDKNSAIYNDYDSKLIVRMNGQKNLKIGLRAENEFGCIGLDEINISPTKLQIGNLPVVTKFCFDIGDLTFKPDISSDHKIAKYQWIRNENHEVFSSDSKIKISRIGSYKLEVTDIKGCKQDIDFKVEAFNRHDTIVIPYCIENDLGNIEGLKRPNVLSRTTGETLDTCFVRDTIYRFVKVKTCPEEITKIGNLYPNPNHGQFILEFNKDINFVGRLIIIDFEGRLQYETYTSNLMTELNLPLTKGTYMCIFINNAGIHSKKLIIN